MFELEKHFRFEAGHVLPFHKGKCSRPHGHSYGLTIYLQSPTLISEGSSVNMVMDFHDVSCIVNPMIETYLDHYWLNDSLKCESPTCEYIAQWIFRHLKPQLPLLHSVRLAETDGASVLYTE